jgi:hypothetical protein
VSTVEWRSVLRQDDQHVKAQQVYLEFNKEADTSTLISGGLPSSPSLWDKEKVHSVTLTTDLHVVPNEEFNVAV